MLPRPNGGAASGPSILVKATLERNPAGAGTWIWPRVLLHPRPSLAFADQPARDAARQAHAVALDAGLAVVDLVVGRAPHLAGIIPAALRGHVDDDLAADIGRLVFGLVLEGAGDRTAKRSAAGG